VKLQNIFFHENPSDMSRYDTDGRTDGHDETGWRFSQLFCENANKCVKIEISNECKANICVFLTNRKLLGILMNFRTAYVALSRFKVRL
jgi:hypothetical protein